MFLVWLSNGYIISCALPALFTLAVGMALGGALAAPYYWFELIGEPELARAYAVVAHGSVLTVLGLAGAHLTMLDKTGWFLSASGILYGPIAYYRQTWAPRYRTNPTWFWDRSPVWAGFVAALSTILLTSYLAELGGLLYTYAKVLVEGSGHAWIRGHHPRFSSPWDLLVGEYYGYQHY